eukprot:scaffold61175_cov75-Phaeocystis_antarctica.AAC.2
MDTLYPGEFGECLEEAWKRPGEQYSRGKLASSALENLQSLLSSEESGIDRATTRHSTHRGRLELGTGTGP